MLADRLRDERVSRITGILNAHHAALVDETADLLANEAEWVGPGVWTIESYLHWRAGVSLATARQLASIARRISDLPMCADAFRSGQLSLDQMTAIARRAPGWLDDQVRDLGMTLTVSQLQRVLRDYPFPTFDADGNETSTDPAETSTDTSANTSADATNNDRTDTGHTTEGAGTDAGQAESSIDPADPRQLEGDDAPGTGSAADAAPGNEAATSTEHHHGGPGPDGSAPVEEYCSYTFGDDGVFRLHAATDFETGSIIAAALDEAHDRLFHSERHAVATIDALRQVAESSLDGVPDAARSARFKTSVFLAADATATDATGWTLPDAIRQHLTCDGLVSPVFVADGVPVSVGRTQRIVPDRTRRLVEQRDHGCCMVPGCTRTVGLDVHHIIHWEHGGATDTHNLLLICSHHHRQHHRGLLGITGNADLPAEASEGVVFTDRSGRRILPSGATPIAPMGPTPPSPRPYRHPLGERLRTDTLHFTQPASIVSPSTPTAPGTPTAPDAPTPPDAAGSPDQHSYTNAAGRTDAA